VLAPEYVPARTAEQLAEFRRKVAWIGDDIRAGRFPRRPRMAFNSPCNLCELHGLCATGDRTGLQVPDAALSRLA
jgi:hypothetical protein